MPPGKNQRRRAARAVLLAGLLALATVAVPDTACADTARGWRAYASGDYEAAIREWRPLAEAGDHEAAYGVGMAWQIMGQPARAVPWYEQAARAGSADAQVLLGTIYARGAGVPRDADVPRGAGVPRDLVRAYAWLRLAVAQKHPNAALLLDDVAGRMTPGQIEAGRRMSAEP